VLDVLKPLGDKKIIETELEGFGIRLNKKPPAILVRKKEKGGIAITNTVPLTNLDTDEIKAILSEYKLNNVDVAIREPNATADDLVDVIEGNRCVQKTDRLTEIINFTCGRVYIPAIYVCPIHVRRPSFRVFITIFSSHRFSTRSVKPRQLSQFKKVMNIF